MNWIELPGPPGYSFLSGALKKEYGRLVKAVEDVHKKRAIADDLDSQRAAAWRRDQATDQSESLRATIGALEAEIRLRDDLEVFLLAADQYATQQQREAQTALLQVELDERGRLGIEDAMPVPIAALQCLPQWHAARRQLAAVDGIGLGNRRSRMEHSEARATAENLVDGLRNQLAAEAKRISRAMATQEQSAAETRQTQAEHNAARLEAHRQLDDQQERAAALLAK